MKKIYEMRWGIETSFLALKYTIGAMHFHAARPQLVEHEIWAAMFAYNATEHAAQEAERSYPAKPEMRREYRTNFSVWAHIVKKPLRRPGTDQYDAALRNMRRKMVPLRTGRHYPRNMAGRMRRRSYFL